MNINKVQHDECDWSIDTYIYLHSSINVLNGCHFTYSQIPEREQNFRKILNYFTLSQRRATAFSRITLSFLDVSKRFKLKLMSAKFLLLLISRNELFLTIYSMAELRRTTGLLFPSQCLCGTILLTLYLMVLDPQIPRAGSMFFYWHKRFAQFLSYFLFFISMDWYWGGGVFGLLRCLALSPGFALPNFQIIMKIIISLNLKRKNKVLWTVVMKLLKLY